jgi:hypothetical protein
MVRVALGYERTVAPRREQAMLFGLTVVPGWVILIGLTLFALLVFEVLVGLRIVKFGRKTNVYHRYIAYTILGIAVVHGFLALTLFGWRIF